MPEAAHRYDQRALGAGIFAVIIWSLAATVAGLLAELDVHFAIVAVYPVILGWVCFALVTWRSREEFLTEARKLSQRQHMGLIAAGLLMMLYEFCFFYALMNAPIVEANILNYLWPIFLMLWTVVVFRRDTLEVTRFQWILVTFAFVGAVVTTLGSRPAGASFGFHPGFAAAVVGAICISGNMALLREAREYFSRQEYPYFISVGWAALFLVVAAYVLGFPLAFSPTPKSVLLLVFEGVVVFALGYWLWLFAIQNYPSISLASIVYGVPVIALLWLYFLLGEPTSPSAAYGMTIIVGANFILHSRYRRPSATAGSIVSLWIAGLVCAVTTSPETRTPGGWLSVGTLFGIIAAFSLDRLAKRNQDRDERFVDIDSALRRTKALLQNNAAGSFVRKADALLRRMVDLELGFSGKRSASLASGIRSEAEGIFEFLSREAKVQSSKELADCTTSLSERVSKWLLSVSDRMPLGERVAVWLLGITSAVLVVVDRSNSWLGDLTAIAVATGIGFLLFTIHDLDTQRMDRGLDNFLTIENAFLHLGLKPYVPSQLLEAEEVPNLESEFEVRTDGPDGTEVLKTLRPRPQLERVLFVIVAAWTLLTVVYVIAVKHVPQKEVSACEAGSSLVCQLEVTSDARLARENVQGARG